MGETGGCPSRGSGLTWTPNGPRTRTGFRGQGPQAPLRAHDRRAIGAWRALGAGPKGQARGRGGGAHDPRSGIPGRHGAARGHHGQRGAAAQAGRGPEHRPDARPTARGRGHTAAAREVNMGGRRLGRRPEPGPAPVKAGGPGPGGQHPSPSSNADHPHLPADRFGLRLPRAYGLLPKSPTICETQLNASG